MYSRSAAAHLSSSVALRYSTMVSTLSRRGKRCRLCGSKTSMLRPRSRGWIDCILIPCTRVSIPSSDSSTHTRRHLWRHVTSSRDNVLQRANAINRCMCSKDLSVLQQPVLLTAALFDSDFYHRKMIFLVLQNNDVSHTKRITETKQQFYIKADGHKESKIPASYYVTSCFRY